MNFNSQICTAKEQSERLLALGLKKETADMGWGTITLNGEPITFSTEDCWDNVEITEIHIPAWSLNRLIEMMPNSIHNKRILAYLTIMNDRVLYDTIKNETYFAFTNNNGLFAAVVDAIEWLIKEGYFNKEYLV